jgi:hypothetical protein
MGLNGNLFFIAGSKTILKKNYFLKTFPREKTGGGRDSAPAQRLIKKINRVDFFSLKE